MSWIFVSLSSVILFLTVAADAEREPTTSRSKYYSANCDYVEDFLKCAGKSDFFCPGGIQCMCKDQKPYCDCPNFRGPRGDYWYMGAQCDQKWNTLDLILVTVLPAAALAMVVAVAAQLIHFCKTTKKKKPPKASQRQAAQPTAHSHQNQAYDPEMFLNQRYAESAQVRYNMPSPHQVQRMSGQATGDPYPEEQRFKSHHVMQESHVPNTPYSHSNSRLENMGISLPEQDYDIAEYREPQTSHHVHKLGVPVLPRNSPDSSFDNQQSHRPYGIGRPQIKNE